MKDLITTFAAPNGTYNPDPGEYTKNQNAGGNLQDNIINIINVIIGVLGLVAVVVIIYGGVQYMTSTGESSKVKKAKDTILYGVIGLIICILAFAIVNFVIKGITGAQ